MIVPSSFPAKESRSHSILKQVREAVARAADTYLGQPNTPDGRAMMLEVLEQRLQHAMRTGRIESYAISDDEVTYTRRVFPMSKDTTGALTADEMEVQIDEEEEQHNDGIISKPGVSGTPLTK